jgi:hypothetical protein
MLASWRNWRLRSRFPIRHFDLGSPSIHFGGSRGFSAGMGGFGRSRTQKLADSRVSQGLIVESRSLRRASLASVGGGTRRDAPAASAVDVRQARESCFGGSDGLRRSLRVASAMRWPRSGSLSREGVRRSLRRRSFAAISCVRNWALRRSRPWRCGDVEIRSFGLGFEHHPVERASSVDFGRSGRTWKHRLRSMWKGVVAGRGFRPAATASWVCIEISQYRASA